MFIAIHEVVKVKNTNKYNCRACHFWGILSEAVEHAVKNQFIVVEPKQEQEKF